MRVLNYLNAGPCVCLGTPERPGHPSTLRPLKGRPKAHDRWVEGGVVPCVSLSPPACQPAASVPTVRTSSAAASSSGCASRWPALVLARIRHRLALHLALRNAVIVMAAAPCARRRGVRSRRSPGPRPERRKGPAGGKARRQGLQQGIRARVALQGSHRRGTARRAGLGCGRWCEQLGRVFFSQAPHPWLVLPTH